jgi:hypothetical protein
MPGDFGSVLLQFRVSRRQTGPHNLVHRLVGASRASVRSCSWKRETMAGKWRGNKC